MDRAQSRFIDQRTKDQLCALPATDSLNPATRRFE